MVGRLGDGSELRAKFHFDYTLFIQGKYALNNILTAIAVFMVLVLSALFAVPMMINWDNYRGDFELRLSEILGSKVELDGSLNVRLLPSPFVSAQDIRIGESGVQGRPILDVKELTLWVSVPPLLKGIIEASTLTLDQPQLLLQFDEKGQPTFKTNRARKQRASEKAAANSSGKQVFSEAALSGFSLSPNLISLKNVQITNGDVILQSSSKLRGGDSEAKIRRAVFRQIDGILSAGTLNGPFYFNGKYTSEKTPQFLRLAIGVEEKDKTYPMNARVTNPVTDRRIEFDGSIGLPVDGGNKSQGWFARGGVKAFLGQVGTQGSLGEKKTAGVKKPALTSDQTITKQQSDQGSKSADGEGDVKSAPVGGNEFYLTAHLDLTSQTADLKNILVRGGSLAQPQTVRGNVKIDWKNELSLVGSADGQSIDLNQIFGTSLGAVGKAPVVKPLDALVQLNELMLRNARQFEKIDFTASAALISVGSGDVRDFQLLVKSDGDVIHIDELSGRLPGSGRFTVSGNFETVKKGEEQVSLSELKGEKDRLVKVSSGFDGQLYLRGLQFNEFARWAMPSYSGDMSFGRGKFMFSGQVHSEGGEFDLTGLQGDVGQSSLRGAISYRRNDVGKVEDQTVGGKAVEGQAKGAKSDQAGARVASGMTKILLNAGRVNVEEFLGKPVALLGFDAALQEFFGGVSKSKEGRNGLGDVLSSDLVVELSAQKLIFDDGEQRDVRLVWRRDGAGERIVSLEGMSANGLRVRFDKGMDIEAGGTVGITGGEQADEDRYLIEASDAGAVQDLIKLSGLGASYELSNEVMDRFLPLRLAMRRQDSEDATQYRFDGVMGGSDAAFSVFVPKSENSEDGKKDNKDAGPVTLLGGMEANNGALLAAKFLPFGVGGQVIDGEFGPAKITFSASGNKDEGFEGQVHLANEFMTASYLGQFAFKGKQIASDGVLKFSGDNSDNVLSLFKLGYLADKKVAGAKPAPFKAQCSFSQTATGFALSDLKIAIGERVIAGTGLFEEKAGEKRYRLALATEKLDFGAMISALQERERGEKAAGDEADSTGEIRRSGDHLDEQAGVEQGDGTGRVVAELWSSKPFKVNYQAHVDDGGLEAGAVGMEMALGEFTIRANELQISDQLSLGDALIQWRAHKDYIELLKVEGKALGGRFIGSGNLRQVAGKYSLDGVAELKDAQLEEVGAADEANVGAGAFSVNLALSGEGKNPRALISALVGQGFVKIDGGVLRQVKPALLGQVAENFMRSETGDEGQLKEEIEQITERAEPLKLGNVDIGLQLIDGVVKLRQGDFGIKPGEIGLKGELSLVDLNWEGDWTIQPSVKSLPQGVPFIHRRVRGDLTSPGSVVSDLEIGEFQRFLILKRQEKEVRNLERVRLEEQERRLAEQKRQAEEELRRLEAEKKRLLEEQRRLDDLQRSDLPLLEQ